MKKQKPDAVLMLARFFVDAYQAALAELKDATAALLDESVQAMRRLYVAARARAEAAMSAGAAA
jgi:hypothetical protein